MCRLKHYSTILVLLSNQNCYRKMWSFWIFKILGTFAMNRSSFQRAKCEATRVISANWSPKFTVVVTIEKQCVTPVLLSLRYVMHDANPSIEICCVIDKNWTIYYCDNIIDTNTYIIQIFNNFFYQFLHFKY